MRAYIITTYDNHGRVADLSNYPSILPTPELYYGVTPTDTVTPNWWLESHKKHKDNVPERVYCCNKSKELLLRKHREKFPNEDILMMEDDVIFTPDADDKYSEFLYNLPGNWGLQYLGGWHEFSQTKTPYEVVPGVLRCLNVLGTEAVLIRSNLVDKAIETLSITPDNDYYICDWQLVNMQRRYMAYTPIGFVAYQQSGFSTLWQAERKWERQRFYYKSVDGKLYYY